MGNFWSTPKARTSSRALARPNPSPNSKQVMPKAFGASPSVSASSLKDIIDDMQDIEFTIEDGKLWMLQTRTGKRTGFAAMRIAVDMVEERIISQKEALLRIEPDQLNQLLRPIFDQKDKERAHQRRPSSWLRVCPPDRAPPPGASYFMPRMRLSGKSAASALCFAALKPVPTIFAAWTQRRVY